MPRSNQAIQRPDLGAVAYEALTGADSQGFIAQKVLPVFETPIQSAEYPVIPMEALLKTQDTSRTARGNYNRDTYAFDLQNYSCLEYGHEEPLDDSESNLYRRFFDAESVAVERAVSILLRSYESRVASITQNVANAAGSAAANVAWGTPATATPKADIDGAIQALRNASGVIANTVVMSWTAWRKLLVTNELKTYLQYTSPHLMQGEQAQMDTVARYFGVDQVLIASSIQDTANKAKATVIADVWSNTTVNVMRLSTGGNNLKEPTFGRTFLWTGDSPNIVTTEAYREEQTRSNVYRVRNYIDEAVQFTGANYLLTGV